MSISETILTLTVGTVFYLHISINWYIFSISCV